jgi:hypothetical protein
MPALDVSGKQTSFFEFWPTWLVYLPVVLQSLLLALRYRSLTLPLIANPRLPLSGMVGVEKSALLKQAGGRCQQVILPWFVHLRTDAELSLQLSQLEQTIKARQFTFPLVCKPDIGCRGSGVKLVQDRQQLLATLQCYPPGAGMFVQTLASWEPEAGIFYVRHPHQDHGDIISMALKYTPYVVGDGQRSLRQLIADDQRAGELQHLYFQRHADQLETVIAAGQPFRLVFAASHCRGAIFRDARSYISEALVARIDQLMQDIPEFHYGRLDIKFKDIDSLQRGEQLQIVEINSASSESLHIWDRNTSLSEAITSLLFQYRTLFKLGASNRRRGYTTPRLGQLLAAWKKERQLTRSHPATD